LQKSFWRVDFLGRLTVAAGEKGLLFLANFRSNIIVDLLIDPVFVQSRNGSHASVLPNEEKCLSLNVLTFAKK